VVDRETVTSWLVRWEESETDGLDDDPKSGRPATLSDEEEKQAIEIVKEEPRSLKQQLLSVIEKFGKKLSLETLRNLCRRHGLSWRRIRRSLKGLRDEALFRQAKDVLEGLKAAHQEGLCDLYEEAENAPLLAVGMNPFSRLGFQRGAAPFGQGRGLMPRPRRRDVRRVFSPPSSFTC